VTIVRELLALSGGALEASAFKTITRPNSDELVDPSSGGWTIEGSSPAATFFGSVNEVTADEDVTFIKMQSILTGDREKVSLGFVAVAVPVNDEGVFLQLRGKVLDTAGIGTASINVRLIDPVTLDSTFIRTVIATEFPIGSGASGTVNYADVVVNIPEGTIPVADWDQLIFQLDGFQQALIHPEGGGMRITQVLLCIPNGLGADAGAGPAPTTIALDTFTSTLSGPAVLNNPNSGYVSDLGFGGWFANLTWELFPSGATTQARNNGSVTDFFASRCVSSVVNDNFEAYADIDQDNGGGVDIEFRHDGLSGGDCFRLNVLDDAGTMSVTLNRIVSGVQSQVENPAVGVAWPNVDINGGYRSGVNVAGNQVTIWVEPLGGGTRTNFVQKTTGNTFWDASNGGSDFNDSGHQKFGWSQGSNLASFNSIVDNFTVIA